MKKGIKKVILGCGLIILTWTILIIFVISVFDRIDNIEKTFKIPGKIKILVTKPGKYYLWNDFRTIFEGKTYVQDRILPHDMSFSLMQKKSQTTIPFIDDRSKNLIGDDEARASIGYFSITTPGEYELAITGDTAPRIFSWGREIFKTLSLWVVSLLFMFLEFALMGTGVALIVLGFRDEKEHYPLIYKLISYLLPFRSK